MLLRKFLEYFSLFLIKRMLIWGEASRALSGGIKGGERAQAVMQPHRDRVPLETQSGDSFWRRMAGLAWLGSPGTRLHRELQLGNALADPP